MFYKRFVIVLFMLSVYSLVSYLAKYEIKLVERVRDSGAILVEYEYFDESEELNRKRKDHVYGTLFSV